MHTTTDSRDHRPTGRRAPSKQATAVHYAGMAQIARWERLDGSTIGAAHALAERIGTMPELTAAVEVGR